HGAPRVENLHALDFENHVSAAIRIPTSSRTILFLSVLTYKIQSAAKLRARHRAGAIDQKSSQEIKIR
ncbi:MAG: hypothetical protein VYA01_02855, partial [Bacteroidota bacterium]|nr:hypothetical protein [Bacteroidota bacterium]